MMNTVKKCGFSRRIALSAFVMCAVTFAFPIEGFAGKIIRPWRATTAIVVDGSTFEIWYDIDSGQTVNSIDLKSEHKTISNVSFTTQTGNWEYDFHSGNIYDRIYTVTVPEGTPEDRYELILNTSNGLENSDAAVKVIQEYRDEYYIVGTSCAHRYQNSDADGDGDSDDDDKVLVLRKMSEILKVSDILDVQLFFEAGDNIYSPGSSAAYYNPSKYPGRPNRSRHHEYFQGIEELDIWGVHKTSAATFMTAGNHEAPDNNVNGEPADVLAEYFNDNWGMYYHNTIYGNARYLNINNGWGGGSYDPSRMTRILRDELDAVGGPGRGNFITGILHKKQESSTGPYNTINFDLSLVGHNHTDAQFNPRDIPLDGNPDNLAPANRSPAMQYVADSNRQSSRFELNLFKINNTNGTYSTPSGSTARMLIIEGNVTSKMGENPSTWVRKLTLDYASNNNGDASSNTGTISSRHNFLIEDAKIRFVMAPGAEYDVDNGVIRQQFTADNGDVIVDVAVNVPANTNVAVQIFETVVADNNALYVSDTIPTYMNPGETYPVTVTMKNTGLDTWSLANGHKLGASGQVMTDWNIARDNVEGTVAPEANHTFSFNLTAPEARGLYDFQMQMVDDIQPNQEWFGAMTPLIQVQVGPEDILIEAEDFVTTDGVTANTNGSYGFIAQNTSDTGGGENLGFTDVGDFATYDVEITHAGTYYLESRIASPSAGANFEFKEGSTVLTTVSTSSTGGFQTWETFTNTVTLTTGSKTFTMLATGPGWNINWLKLIPADGMAPQFTSTPVQRVEVGQAYSYTPTANDAEGNSFSFSAVTLPSSGWLTFNGSVLTGTPAEGDIGDNKVTLRVTDSQGLASDQSFNILVAAVPEEGDLLLAVDLQNEVTDVTESGFTGWAIGEVVNASAAPTIEIDGYLLALGAGSSVACLTDATQQTGMNTRNRTTRYIVDSGSFTQDEMMRERVASSASPTDPATGNGTGTGIYLKITGLSPNTNYTLQAWGVDFNSDRTLKNGYVYGFDSTSESGGYASLPQVGTYTISGTPATIANNDAYSVSGNIRSDSNGTLIYKQISNIDNSVINGFKLFVGPPLQGFDAWALETGAGTELQDPDGDGRVNLLEYALGGNPTNSEVADNGVEPTLSKSVSGWEFKHPSRNGDTSLSYIIQTRQDLLTGMWADLATTPSTASGPGDYVEMTHDLDLPGTQLFIRLKVETE